jgi:hypothetical protein
VSLFKRRGSTDDEDQSLEDTEALDDDESADDTDDETSDGEDSAPVLGERRAAAQAAATARVNGPFDDSEVTDTSSMLDLGALLVSPADDMELRLELNEEGGEHVVGVTVLIGDSAVQIQAFAAPRREGIWDEVRTEIAAGITQQGGTADELEGEFGRELLARVPSQSPDGKAAGFQPARFVGIDGPRWFLRAVFTGAAVEPAKAASIEALVRSLVVVRGGEAMAPRELLPLKLPEMPAEAGSAREQAEPAEDDRPTSTDDLNPFERGPEITEIR